MLGEEHLDENRYEKLKVYSRITGKSLYKEYDTLLETYEDKVHETIETKLIEYLTKKKKLSSLQNTLSKAAKKEIQNRKQSITGKGSLARGSDLASAFQADEENFVKQLDETQ